MAARMKAAALILLKSSIVTCMCVIAGRQKREKGKFSEGNVDVNNKTVRQSLLKLDTPPPHIIVSLLAQILRQILLLFF